MKTTIIPEKGKRINMINESKGEGLGILAFSAPVSAAPGQEGR
jgi:hypothetical protein